VSKAARLEADATAAVILERCAALAQCTERAGTICRTFLSPAIEEAHARLHAWMARAGLVAQLDRAGNILASTTAQNNVPRLLIGSHLDTIPDAGAFDGVLGVLLALALAESQRGNNRSFAIDVAGFSEEEGIRFSAPFIGSRAMCGGLDSELLARCDKDGLTLQKVLEQYEKDHPEAIASHLANGTRGYLEFHIEQGPVLESLSLPLGVVTAIAGQSRGTMTFTGKAGHAGTTPMAHRRDALTAAAEWIGQVEAFALAAPGLVATVGQITALPGAVNVIPAEASCSLDLRHANDSIRDEALSHLLCVAGEIAAKRGVECGWRLTHAQAAVPMHPQMIELAERAIERAGYPVHRMVSGAGHDAMVLAPHLPSGMIFLRSPGGLSHHPDEAVLAEDVAAAFIAGLNFLDEFERAVCAGEITASA
jgi:allantoate deiminase